MRQAFKLLCAAAAATAVAGLVLFPFLAPSTFRFAQLSLFLVLTGALATDSGPGRRGDALRVHQGVRLAVDHLLMLALIGLMPVLALSAPPPLFQACWWAAFALFLALYPLLATGFRLRSAARAEE